LRAAVDLAGLWKAQGQHERARVLLGPALEGFMEGLGSADPKAAQQLLLSL
jgi:hypothetical protein